MGSLFVAAAAFVLLEAAFVAGRAQAQAGALLGYLSVALAASAWAALGCGAAAAAIGTLGGAAIAALRIGGRTRALFGAAGWGLLLGALGVVLIRPWNLHQAAPHLGAIAVGVPVACAAAACSAEVAAARLGPRTRALLGVALGLGVFWLDSTWYRGLYVTLHRTAFFLAWTLAAAALVPLVRGSKRLRHALLALAALSHLGLASAAEARELGVLHGALLPKLTGLLQALSDRDHDGYSAAFGGADCDDGNPEIHPGACELHGNRIDDNCNGLADVAPPSRATRSRTPRAPLPDVYFVLLDAVRADFGVPSSSSAPPSRWPSLTRLAGASLDFRRAYAPYPSTFRSLLATFQARSARNLDASAPELFGIAASAGYDAQLWIAERRLALDAARTRTFLARRADNPFSVKETGAAKRGWTARIVDAAIAEIETDGDGNPAPPRLRWLHLLDAHDPWVHAEAGTPARAAYATELAHLDRNVSRLLAALERSERGRRAAIIVLADHGEQLGEHGVYFHDAFLWEESIHVPLIMRLPGVSPRAIAAPASLLDVVPTLASYLGLPAHASFQGHDWLSEPDRRGAHPTAEVTGTDAFGGVGRPARHAVIGPRYKLMLNVSENLVELYDLERDAGERRPLHRAATPAASDMLDALARWQDMPSCARP